jgi:hypothetical protein
MQVKQKKKIEKLEPFFLEITDFKKVPFSFVLTQHTTCSRVCIPQSSKERPMDLIGTFLALCLADFWCFQQRIGRGP